MNCPFCGAKETGVTGEFDESVLFECGSEACPEESDELNMQSDTCRELCDLRNRAAFAEKWREVVLSHVKSVPSMRFSTGEFIACCKIPIGKADVLDAKEAFDSAVRKEMECES